MNLSGLFIVVNLLGFLTIFLLVVSLWRPVKTWVLNQEQFLGHILRHNLLLDVRPRNITWMSLAGVIVLALLGYGMFLSMLGALAGAAIGVFLPVVTVKLLRHLRMEKLDDQLVSTVESLTSGVKAGLNLVQAMTQVAENMPKPVNQEFAQLLREYEYGTPLDEAMSAAARRIELPNYQLVFSALRTHRVRGGNLAITLEKISSSVREIQRLEKRIESMTAQNRTAARWMGTMPVFILVILYMIDPHGVQLLFTEDIGRIILAIVAALNLVGFMWIRQLVNLDV